MAVVGKLEVLTMVNTAGLESGFAKSAKAMKHFGNQAKSAGGAMGWISQGNISLQGLGKSFFGAALGANLASNAILAVVNSLKQAVTWSIRLVAEQMKWIGSTNKLAFSLGMTARELVGLEHGAAGAGMAAGEFETRMNKMQDTLGEALSGTPSAIAALDQFGLTVEQLAPMSTKERLYAFGEAIKRMGVSAQSAKAIGDVFGRGSGQDMLRFFSGGSAAMEEWDKKVQQSRRTFTELEGVMVEMASGAIANLWNSLKGIATVIAIEVAPALKVMADWITKLVVENDRFREAASFAWDVFSVAMKGSLYVANAFYQVFKGLQMLVYNFFNVVFKVWAKIAEIETLLPKSMQLGISTFMTAFSEEFDRTTKQIGEEFADAAKMDWTTQFARDSKAMLDAAEKTAEERKKMIEIGAAVMPTEAAPKAAAARDLTPAAALRGTAEEYSAIYKARRAMQGMADPTMKVQQDQLQEAKKQGKDIADIARNTRGGFQLAAAGIA